MPKGFESHLSNSNGGSSGNSLKDIYKDIVFNSTGVTACPISGYNSRATVNEGQLIYNSTTKEVFIYVDFTIAQTMGGLDYWTYLSINTNSISNRNICPIREYEGQGYSETLYTDSSSANPLASFYLDYGSPYIKVLGRYLPTAGQRYIVYGAWQVA